MSSKPVSVIIVAAGGRDYLERCLVSLAGQAVPPYEVTVINNSGMPGLETKARALYPTCRMITPEGAVSYAEALNAGIRASTGEYILCLNDDTVLEKDFLACAVDACALNPRIGMVSGKILRSDGRTIDSTGLFISLWRTAQERGYGKKDTGQFDAPGYVFGVTGAVAFYRRSMLEEIKDSQGYFPEHRGYFYEDLDVAWRAQRQGWKAYYAPQAVALHVRGATARAPAPSPAGWARRGISDELLVDLIKNRYATIRKNDSWRGLLAHLPFIVLYDLAAWAHIVFFRPRAAVRFFCRAPAMRPREGRLRADDKVCAADELTIILPTLNEEAGVGVLLSRLLEAYPRVTIIVSDDGSTDKTRQVVKSYARSGVHLLDRELAPVHGLTVSVLEAISMVRTPYFLVMDADGQHACQAIGRMLSCLKQGSALVVGVRALRNTQWPVYRKFFFRVGTFLGKTRLALGGKGWARTDILSGFFAARTEFWKQVACAHAPQCMFRLRGYKILFDFFKQLGRGQPYAQVEYVFHRRQQNSSKMSRGVILEYVKSLFC